MSDHGIVSYSFRLRQALRSKGLTLRALALKARVDRAGLRRIRDGQALPSWGVACRIAEALGMDLGALIGRRVRRPVSDVRPDGARETKGGRDGD